MSFKFFFISKIKLMFLIFLNKFDLLYFNEKYHFSLMYKLYFKLFIL